VKEIARSLEEYARKLPKLEQVKGYDADGKRIEIFFQQDIGRVGIRGDVWARIEERKYTAKWLLGAKTAIQTFKGDIEAVKLFLSKFKVGFIERAKKPPVMSISEVVKKVSEPAEPSELEEEEGEEEEGGICEEEGSEKIASESLTDFF
jgi:hypothetical protein